MKGCGDCVHFESFDSAGVCHRHYTGRECGGPYSMAEGGGEVAIQLDRGDRMWKALFAVLPLAKAYVEAKYAHSCDPELGMSGREEADRAAIREAISALEMEPSCTS